MERKNLLSDSDDDMRQEPPPPPPIEVVAEEPSGPEAPEEPPQPPPAQDAAQGGLRRAVGVAYLSDTEGEEAPPANRAWRTRSVRSAMGPCTMAQMMCMVLGFTVKMA